MMCIEAPEVWERSKPEEKAIFLGGGITNCPDWQIRLIHMLKDEEVTLLSPRRAEYILGDRIVDLEQRKWEHYYLRKADAISFWFPKESVCPIALYGLGAWSMTNKPIFVGMDPDYPRKADVFDQTLLTRPDVTIKYDLEDLAKDLKLWLKFSDMINDIRKY